MRAFYFAALLASALAQDVSTTRAQVTVTFVPTVTVLTTETVVVIPEQSPIVRNTTVCGTDGCRASTVSLTLLPPTTFFTTITLSSYKTSTSSITDASPVSISGTRTYTSVRKSTATKVITGPDSTTTVEVVKETLTVSTCAHPPSTDVSSVSSADTQTPSSLPVTTITVYPIPAQATNTVISTSAPGNLSMTYILTRSGDDMSSLTMSVHSLSTLKGQHLSSTITSISSSLLNDTSTISSSSHVYTAFGKSSTTGADMNSTSHSLASWTPKTSELSSSLTTPVNITSTVSTFGASTTVMATLQPSVYRSAAGWHQTVPGIFKVISKALARACRGRSFT